VRQLKNIIERLFQMLKVKITAVGLLELDYDKIFAVIHSFGSPAHNNQEGII